MKINHEIIINETCVYYNLTRAQMFQKSREREIVNSRQMCQTLLSEHARLSLSKIGMLTGGRDHATVLHAKKVIHNLVETDKTIKHDYEFLKRLLKNKKIESKYGYFWVIYDTYKIVIAEWVCNKEGDDYWAFMGDNYKYEKDMCEIISYIPNVFINRNGESQLDKDLDDTPY